MKEGWTYKKLGEVSTFARGLTYSKKDEVESSKNVVLRSNNIDLLSGKLDFSELKYLDDNFEIPADKRVKHGSLFICMSNGSKAHLGKVAYIDKDYNYAFGGFMGQITPTDDVDGLYLHYALSSPFYKDYIKSLSEGANINNLKFKDLSEFVIGYPSLSEQRSIVSRLDAAFAGIDALKANAERQLAEARALFNRALTEEMAPKEGWETMKLGEFAFMKAGDFIKANEIYQEHKEGLYPCYGGNGFRGYVKEPNQDGDYCLIGRQGALCGCINRASGIFRTTEHAVIVKPYKDIPTTLVYYLLVNLNLNKYATGAAQPGLSVKNIAETVVINVPPQKDQKEIAERLDALSANVRKLEEVQRKTLAECDALKQAMLKEVFE